MPKHIPKVRKDCLTGFNQNRPCPWIRCKYHMIWMCYPLYKNFIKQSDKKIINQIMNLSETCVLDVASENGATLERIGEITGMTRERIRQIEFTAILKTKHPVRYFYIMMFKGEIVKTEEIYYTVSYDRINKYYDSIF